MTTMTPWIRRKIWLARARSNRLNFCCQVDQRSSKASSQEELICIQPVSPHLPTRANLIGEKGPETQKHHGHTCICNWSTCICICAKCIVFVITWFRLYLHSYYTSIVLVIVHGRTPWSLTYRPANHRVCTQEWELTKLIALPSK